MERLFLVHVFLSFFILLRLVSMTFAEPSCSEISNECIDEERSICGFGDVDKISDDLAFVQFSRRILSNGKVHRIIVNNSTCNDIASRINISKHSYLVIEKKTSIFSFVECDAGDVLVECEDDFEEVWENINEQTKETMQGLRFSRLAMCRSKHELEFQSRIDDIFDSTDSPSMVGELEENVRGEKVDFLIVGAMKSGTDGLLRTMKLHPDLSLPDMDLRELRMELERTKSKFDPRKDYWYWRVMNEKLLYPSLAELRHFDGLYESVSLDWYLDHFDHGAKNPYYFPKPVVYGTRIVHHNPNVKIIALVRNPVERIYSHYQMWETELNARRSMGIVPNAYDEVNSDQGFDGSFLRLIAYTLDYEEFPYYDLIGYGYYSRHWGIWESIIKESNLMLIKSDDYFKNELQILNNIFGFLGVRQASTLPLPPGAMKSKKSYSPMKEGVMNILTELYRHDVQQMRDKYGIFWDEFSE